MALFGKISFPALGNELSALNILSIICFLSSLHCLVLFWFVCVCLPHFSDAEPKQGRRRKRTAIVFTTRWQEEKPVTFSICHASFFRQQQPPTSKTCSLAVFPVLLTFSPSLHLYPSAWKLVLRWKKKSHITTTNFYLPEHPYTLADILLYIFLYLLSSISPLGQWRSPVCFCFWKNFFLFFCSF
ncbi:hypothetical protein B0T26DRAFT_188255 [Lasiosphaeria miniovina]|uniref:Uncharacterized protein n=1 Tax=Lasiosphaeria miniovina TaxID=1954250 RepID=A0AA40AT78_9PEZI|nr:uncharacterized protein B0T26DRAFT_188255 [Lasiosphaeria miniovina]KAK0721590.1 hypothetical protein B0T26DRAFT_188255 [Lasiosphaeria miniovina]